MALTYCILKMFQQSHARHTQKKTDEPNFFDTTINPLKKTAGKICRVCLKKGNVPIIPKSKSTYTVEALQIIADINIVEDDDYPKFLCQSCHSILKGAMLLRALAQKSDAILKNVPKIELLSEDSNDNGSGDDHVEDIKSFSSVQNPEGSLRKSSYSAVTLVSAAKTSTGQTVSNMSELSIKKKNEKTKCKICHKEINKYYYKDHLARHGIGAKKAKVMTKCSTCNKPLEKAYLRQHMTSVHGMPEKQFVCFVCGKTYKYQGGYNCHILTHTNEFPSKCHLCPYRGRHSGLLKVHMRTHTREFKYQCSDCPARFLTNGNLRKHMQRHQEPTFHCETCNKGFFSKTTMERHYQVDHMGIKNHICNICEKAFGYRSAMMKHQIKVHKRAKMPKGRNAAYLQAERKNQASL